MLTFVTLIIAIHACFSVTAQAENLLTKMEELVDSALQVVSVSGLLNFIDSVSIGASPTNVEDAVNAITQALNDSQGQPVLFGGLLKSSGIYPQGSTSLGSIAEQLSGCGEPCTDTNSNPREPARSVYSPRSSGDAPWSQTEADLRSALYFPPGYTYGKVSPLLMVPGTGLYGSQSYKANLGKKLEGSDIADPVYLNVPEYLLDDAQVNGEYVAYAIKYVSAISGGGAIGVVTLSQGSVDTAWALQYWPSTRNITSDVVNLSGDYKGASITDVVCLLPVCEYSLWQQQLQSNFITTLREGGASSAYVPTTSIMSLTDECVTQLGGKAASGYIEDARNVGVSNYWIQEACALQPGGGVYDHVGVLFSNLAYELTVDALTHDGPGKVERLDLSKTCGEIATPGLSVLDIIESQLTIVVAFFNIFSHPATAGEPPIRSYAQ